MKNTVIDYDSAELHGIARLPNRAIEAFQAAHFSSVGYPFRVKHASELWRYIDVMHEGRFEANLRLLKRITPKELDLAQLLARKTLAYSQLHFGRNLTGRHSITRALLQLRSLSIAGYNCGEARNILELGPGSGFLSLLMALTGHAVSTVDVAQAFALHQAALFRHFFSGHISSDFSSRFRVTRCHSSNWSHKANSVVGIRKLGLQTWKIRPSGRESRLIRVSLGCVALHHGVFWAFTYESSWLVSNNHCRITRRWISSSSEGTPTFQSIRLELRIRLTFSYLSI